MPFVEDDGGDLAGFDLAAAAPEDVGVFDRDAGVDEVFVDGGFVGEDGFFVGAVDDAHDVDIGEAFAAFAPVGVGHDGVTTDFTAGAFLHAFGDFPVEEGVEAGDADAGGAGLDVFEEGGEATDDAFGVEAFGDFAELFHGDACGLGAA